MELVARNSEYFYKTTLYKIIKFNYLYLLAAVAQRLTVNTTVVSSIPTRGN